MLPTIVTRRWLRSARFRFFIAGNIKPAIDYVKDIFGLLDLYQDKYPNSNVEIQEEIERIDLDYLRSDLLKLSYKKHLNQ